MNLQYYFKKQVAPLIPILMACLCHTPAQAEEKVGLELSNSASSLKVTASEEVKNGRANIPWADDNYALDLSYVEKQTFLLIMQDKVKKIRTSVFAHNSAIENSSLTQDSSGETKIVVKKNKAKPKPELKITRLEVAPIPKLYLACTLSHSVYKEGSPVSNNRILTNFQKLALEEKWQLNAENDDFSYSITVDHGSEKMYLELANKNSGVVAKFESKSSALQPGVLMALTEGNRDEDAIFLVLNCAIKDNVRGLFL